MAEEIKEAGSSAPCPCVFCKKEEEYLKSDKAREEKLYAKGAVGRVMAHPTKMPAKMPSKLTEFNKTLKAGFIDAHTKEITAAGAPACTAVFDKLQAKYAACLAEYANSENYSDEHFELLKRKVSEAIIADGGKGSPTAVREAFAEKMKAFNTALKNDFAAFTKNGGIPAPQNESVRKVTSMGSDSEGVVDMLKGDVSDATWRVAAEKMIETAKAPLVGFVVGTGKIDNAAAKLALMGFFESELGTGILAGLVGGALTALPFDDDGGKKKRLAKELRTLFFQKGIKKGADILTAPIEQALKNIAAGGDVDARIEELFGNQLNALPPAVPVEETQQVEVTQKEKVAVPAAQ